MGAAARPGGARSALLAVVTVWALAGADPASAQEPSPEPGTGAVVTAQDIVRTAAGGQPVDLADATVTGNLDLRPLGTITRPLRCRRCRLTGSLTATDVVFERVVDLRRSSVEGGVELEGAVFEDGASFDGIDIAGPVALDAVRAEANVSFTAARLEGPSHFDRARFGAGVFFAGATFGGDASFAGTEFGGKVDFGQAAFRAGSTLAGAVFTARATFALATFAEEAVFSGAELRGGANLRFMTLASGGTFDRVSAVGALELDGTVVRGEASFDNLATSGTLSLLDLRPVRAELFMERVSAGDLLMDIGTVGAVRGRTTQKRVLRLIEEGAKERGDLSVANDARFRLLELEGEDKAGAAGRLLDAVHRDVGGYLVRPWNPLLAFVVALAATALVRALPGLVALAGRRGQAGGGGPGPAVLAPLARAGRAGQRGLLVVEQAVALVLGGLAASLAVAFRAKPGVEISDRDRVRAYFLAGARVAEFVAYKGLLAVFLLALGSSNATVRELLDAVRP